MPHITTKNQNSHMAITGAHVRAGRGSEPVGRQGPETAPKCWYMYVPCWATAISKLMLPNKYAWYPPPPLIFGNIIVVTDKFDFFCFLNKPEV